MHTTHTLARRTARLLSALSLLLAAQFASAADPAPTGLTQISNDPLARALTSVEPNIMFILDDSGSMAWDYMPDYVTTNSAGTFRNCRPQASISTGNLLSSLTECYFGDIAYNAYEFNSQYYNPNIYYRPSPVAGGEDDPARNLNRTNTNGWVAISNDVYGIATTGLPGVSGTTIDLTTQVPHRVWCKGQDDDVTSANCLENSDHSYPSGTYKYGKTSGGDIKYRYGAPYYYRVTQPQYCETDDKINCQTAKDGTHPVRTPVRFCTDNTLSTCQAKRDSTHKYPYFAGQLNPGTLTAETLATATITVLDSKTDASATLTQIYVGTVPLLKTAVTASGGTDSSTERKDAAKAIRNSINNATATHGFTAALSSDGLSVIVTAPVGSGDTLNGTALQPTIIAGTSRASVTLKITKTPNETSATKREFLSLAVDGKSLILSKFTLPQNDPKNAAQYVASAVNSYNTPDPWDYTADYQTFSTYSTVTIYAPLDIGAAANGLSLTYDTDNNTTISPSSGSGSAKLSGGAGGGNLPVSTTSFAGGVAPSGTPGYWTSDIQFERVDITPETAPGVPKTFPRGDDERKERVDCTSSTYCTYDEEMTNYANWYTYYRTRMQSAKTSAGRAFAQLGDNMRVGYITISPGSPVSSDQYLKINNFAYDATAATGHKKDWYDKLYAANPSGGTPLREALSRVGRLYAGVFDDGINKGIKAEDDPIQYACQPNFAILTTDGYWNGNGGKTTTGTDIGNEDNVDDGFSDRATWGAYDGGFSGSKATLADVAMYYYKNDLRTGMDDTVFTTKKDTAQHQHMTTFTVGLGLSGQLNYIRHYETQPGDFLAIKQGSKDWPVPAADSETALDDLWHAAVNGRGTFYSAANPQDFQSGLSDALNQMFARAGAGAAAATSNLQPTAGDNFAFTAEYETQTWIGDLVARTIDTTSGVVSTRTLWSAGELLKNRNFMDRVIYTYDPDDDHVVGGVTGSGNKLRHLCWPTVTPGATCNDGSGLTVVEQGYFATSQLSQASSWGTNQQNTATASNLFDYIRGDRTNETTGGFDDHDLYRSRKWVLGDIIDSQPAYIKESPFNYSDAHYQDYRAITATRRGTVYAAANDGMLHAFETDVNNDPYYQTAGISTDTETDDTFTGNNSGNGAERWAYMPSLLMKDIYQLAEDPYKHSFFADGSPVIGDVCDGHTATTPCADTDHWHTILVAGLNAGGRGYYALDITSPTTPKALWEFTSSDTCLTDAEANDGTHSSDCNVGLSYGNPLIVKRPSDDKWVVIVTSGYNNVGPGDGKGYLYILDAMTGKILKRLTTGVGDAGTAGDFSDATPSGLGRINAYASNAIENNQALTVYGGDLLGNLWRFNLSTYAVTKLTTLLDGNDKAQPITVKPEIGEVTPYRIILLGTGRYLGKDDVSDHSVQTIYAIRDDNSGDEVEGRSVMLPRTISTVTSTTRKSTAATDMDWTNYKGWYADLPDLGERVNVDPQLQLGTLIVASNVPTSDTSCQAGGYAWINYFDYKKGTGTGEKIGSAMVVGLSTIKLGSTVHTIVTTADNQRTTVTPPVSTTAFAGRRVSWRELIAE